MNRNFLLDIPFDLVTANTFISTVEDHLREKISLQITTPNPEHLVQAQENPDFKQVLQNSDLSIPDGVGIICGLKIQSFIKSFRSPLSALHLERFTGIEAMLQLCSWAETKNYKVALVGGFENVAEQATQKLKQKFPKLDIISHPGHNNVQELNDKEDKEIINFLNTNEVQILCLAYGAPFQEWWIAKHLHELSTIKVAIGVGGAFDVISGKLKRAPLWIQNLGLEWLYRLVQQPWRWKRQMRLLKFIELVITR